MSTAPNPSVKAVVFDLDDTLAPSKSTMDPSMRDALVALLERVEVCIISGGRFEQFQAQALDGFSASEEAMHRLHLMPTCGTRYYLWQNGDWRLQYAEDLTEDEKARTIATLEAGARELGLWAAEPWGDIIEDRGSQITFSALGQQAPIDAKMAWDPDGAKKRALGAYASPLLPDLEVRGGGSTSIDVTRKGIDKAYGVNRLLDKLALQKSDLLFIGDRLDEGGNDYPVFELGVRSVAIHGWEQTRDHVLRLVEWLDHPTDALPVPVMEPLAAR